MNPRDLTEAARDLTESGRGRPTQARLRRAVSTTYYAMFHCLAATAADLFVGRKRGPAWHRAYRALEHGKAGNACRQGRTMREFPTEIRRFAERFATLQVERQQADYALDGNAYLKSDVLVTIAAAERAIGWVEQADARHRRAFATHVLFRRRPS